MPQRVVAEPDALDHALEFVARVATETPGEYARLLKSAGIKRLLEEENAFNPGKLYVWAEYRIFRREFGNRFPEAEPRACINAFCRLFLKNDISLSNLVRALEDPRDENLARLAQRGRTAKKPAG